MTSTTLKHRGLAISAAATLACTLAAQTAVTVPCMLDNTLYQHAAGALSNGIGDSLFVGVTGMNSIRRAVLRFDVAAAVPANATVVAASLNLNCAQTSVALPMAVTAHRLLQAWGEGTSNAITGGGGGGAPSTAGDATWLHTFWPGTTWASAGGDFDAAPTVTMSMPTFGAFSSPSTLEMTAAVQEWLDNPASNFGWLLRTDELLASTSHRLHSRESTLASARPTLTVSYLLPGTAGSWGTGCPIGTGTFTNVFGAAPIGGTTIPITKTNATPLSIGADFFSLALDPVGVPLLPGCTVYLPLTQLLAGGVFLTDGAGAGATTFAVPLGFPGYLVTCQAVVLDPNPLGLVVSDAALAVLQ